MNNYHGRCKKKLYAMGAPLEGWMCIGIDDMIEEKGELSTCELCGCEKVRFMHQMQHEDFSSTLEVGCICAGVMEGDLLAAKARERQARNRAKRRQTFLDKGWRRCKNGNLMLRHKGHTVFINRLQGGFFRVNAGEDGATGFYRNQRISSLDTAKLAAFDLVDHGRSYDGKKN